MRCGRIVFSGRCFCLLAILGLCARGQDVKNGPPKALVDEIGKYERLAANNPTNYNARYSLSQLYTSCYLWSATNSVGEAEGYRRKSVAATESALSAAPDIYARVFLGMTFELLNEPNRALPIYKDFIGQAEKTNEIPSNVEVAPSLRAKVQKERAALLADVERRVHIIEGQSPTSPGKQ